MTIGDHELDAIRSADERSVIASRPPLLSLRIDFLAENLSSCAFPSATRISTQSRVKAAEKSGTNDVRSPHVLRKDARRSDAVE